MFLILDDKKAARIHIAITSCMTIVLLRRPPRTVLEHTMSFNNGLCLDCIILDSKHKPAISMYTGNSKKGKKASDQTRDVNESLFEKLLKAFEIINHIAAAPREEHYKVFLEEDKCNWDLSDTVFSFWRTSEMQSG